jgi:membrane-associated phospholipid phosphatase
MVQRAKAPLAACLGCALALVALTYLAYEVGPGVRLDAHLLDDVSEHQVTLGGLANALVHLGDPLAVLLLAAVACGLALLRGSRRDALAALVVVAGANLTTQALKVVLAHPRYQPLLGWHQPSAEAFPSGHTTAAASVAIAFLFAVAPRWRPPALALGAAYVAAVGCSVVVLDKHYPSDVAGGLLVAAGWGFAVLAAQRALGPGRLGGYDERAAIVVK